MLNSTSQTKYFPHTEENCVLKQFWSADTHDTTSPQFFFIQLCDKLCVSHFYTNTIRMNFVEKENPMFPANDETDYFVCWES